MRKALVVFLCLSILLLSALPAAADSSVAYATTPLNNSSNAKITNIELALEAIDGMYVGYGETFSFNDAVGPRTEERGYLNALNGRGVKYRGGGVSQVATTLYLALKGLGSDIEYTSKKTYGNRFADDYVRSGKDAIITDYEAGTDFKFYNGYGDMRIWAYLDGDRVVVDLTDAGDYGDYYDSEYYGGETESSASTKMIDSRSLRNNIELAVGSINDTTLCYGDEFSFNDIVGPRTERYGYESAINGRGVKVIGGGVAQVASTIWLAIKDLDDIKFLEKKTYGDKFNQKYVSSKNDAIVTDYSAKTDFRFRYTGDGEMTIYTYVEGDWVYCEVTIQEDW